VHIWNGEQSVKEYLAQLDRDHQQVSGFGGILMARAGEIERTRAKNDELIGLAKRSTRPSLTTTTAPAPGTYATRRSIYGAVSA
jgi:hypothetical protein